MGIGGLGMWEMVFIFLLVLLLFGAKRLPEIGSSLGKGIREFKGSLREIEGEIKGSDEGRGGESRTEAREPRTLRASDERPAASRASEPASEPAPGTGTGSATSGPAPAPGPGEGRPAQEGGERS